MLTGNSQDGVIYFTGVIAEVGFCVQPTLPVVGAGLQTRSSASGNQVILNFRSAVAWVMLVDASMEVRGASSLGSLRVGGICGKTGALTKYGGSEVSLLTANNGTLTLSRVLGVEPAPAVVMLSYQQ